MAAKSRNGRGGARPGSGPKPRPAALLKRNRLMLNLTDHEYAALRKAAGKESPSQFAREVLVRYLRRKK